MIDDKKISLGTNADLQIKYANASDEASIGTSATQMTLSASSTTLQSAGGSKYIDANGTNTIIYHDNAARVTTTATGISIGGAIDAFTSITSSGNIAVATD